MKRLIRILDISLKGGLILTTILMIVACTLQVLTRFILPHPLSWTEELARYSFIWWSFIGAAYVVRLNGHLGMDILVNTLPLGGRVFLQKLVFLVSLVFMVLVTYTGVRITIRQAGQEGTILPISMAWVYLIVPLTGAIMALYLLYLLFYWTHPQAEGGRRWLPEDVPETVVGPPTEDRP